MNGTAVGPRSKAGGGKRRARRVVFEATQTTEFEVDKGVKAKGSTTTEMPASTSAPNTTSTKLDSASKSGATSLGGGWQIRWQGGSAALGKQDARAFARGVFRDEADPDGNARPWAVRGEVPYEDPKALCPCVEIVQSGVRMKLPEKLFARNFLELVQRGNDGPCISIYIDAASALQRWAVLSRVMLDDKRAGNPVWSGWTAAVDREAQAAIEQRSQSPSWAALGFSRREEWDWTYRTDAAPVISPGPGGLCDRSRQRWEAMGPCEASGASSGSSSEGAHEPGLETSRPRTLEGDSSLHWVDDESDDQSDDYLVSENAAWLKQAMGEANSPQFETEFKLYEDFLDELGVSSLTAQFVCFSNGWLLRLRWWSMVNPAGIKGRGAPHCRLRDTTLRVLHGTGVITRTIEERHLQLDYAGETDGSSADVISNGCDASSASLSAEVMAARMHRVTPRARRQSLQYAEPNAVDGVASAEVALEEIFDITPQPSQDPAGGHVLSATRLTSPNEQGCVVAGDAWSGDLALLCRGIQRWHRSEAHGGLEALALAAPPPGTDGASSDQNGLVLSSANDGHVRAWDAATGESMGACLIEDAVGADSERRGGTRLCVVQCVTAIWASTSALPVTAAAAAGRSVFSLPLQPGEELGEQLVLVNGAMPRPPLPSAVTALVLGRSGLGMVYLCAATAAAGLFLWEDSDDPAAGPSMVLPCGGSCLSLQLNSGGDEYPLLCFSGNFDGTLRVWPGQLRESTEEEADGAARHACQGSLEFPTRPLTFGGTKAKVRAFDIGRTDESWNARPFIALPDGPGGAVIWHLSDVRLGADALGVDSRCSSRLRPPTGLSVLAVTFERRSSSEPASGYRLACGYSDSSVSVFELDSASSWRLAHHCVVHAASLSRPQTLASEVGDASVALHDDWLYFNSTDRGLHIWYLQPHSSSSAAAASAPAATYPGEVTPAV